MNPILELRDINVRYGGFDAVTDAQFSLNQGESLALLGRNGAGKTSTLRVILGMLKPKSGTCQIFGSQPGKVEALRNIGFAPEEATPPDFLSGQEYLELICDLRHVDRSGVLPLLEWFELQPKKRIAHYSKGMYRRLILAQALLGSPRLLILDEPLNGLDPIFIKKLRDRLEDYCKTGGSLIFSSHILAEVERVCSHVLIINEGRVRKFAPAKEVTAEFGSIEKAFVAIAGDMSEKHPTP